MSGITLLRARFHEALRGAPELHGSVIDVGGMREPASTYMDVLSSRGITQLTVVNIDSKVQPDVLADAAKLPLPDAGFDAALCFNLLEHVAEPERVLGEIARVLKSGGICLLETPFLVNVHAHPHDYFRFTDTALRRMVERAGLRVTECRALGGGPFLASVAMIQPFFPRWIFIFPLGIARVFDAIILSLRPSWSERWPLGYFVVCQKP
jgi:SAM-dependent methyltransferase